MSRRGWGTLAIVWGLMVIGLGAVVVGAPPGSEAANRVADSWIQAMAQPSGDRGWSQLSPETQAFVYGGDAERYWSDIADVDWAAIAWAPAQGRVGDGALYSGEVWLRSHPSTLPHFLIERGLAVESCTDDVAFGIHLQMRVGWFEEPRILGQLEKGAVQGRCALAFQHPGALHEPFDIVAAAWASPGSIQRVGVLDSSGLVSSAGAGRADPPLDGSAAVSAFGLRELAVTWRGAACDSNSTIVVSGTEDALTIVVRRGHQGDCAGTNVVYESILTVRSGIAPERVRVQVSAARLSLCGGDGVMEALARDLWRSELDRLGEHARGTI